MSALVPVLQQLTSVLSQLVQVLQVQAAAPGGPASCGQVAAGQALTGGVSPDAVGGLQAAAVGGSMVTPAVTPTAASRVTPTATPAATGPVTPRPPAAPVGIAPSAGTPSTVTAPQGRGAAARDPHEPVLVIGDSLTVGIDGSLKKDLSGQQVTVDARVGRGLKEGMDHYNSVANKPRVVEMALFTNNGPGEQESLRKAIQQTISDARARHGRVIWATIVRPDVGGTSYDAVNDMIRQMARENADVMGLVDWAAAVAQHPDFLAGDHVHGTTAGYRWRAQAFADAAKQ